MVCISNQLQRHFLLGSLLCIRVLHIRQSFSLALHFLSLFTLLCNYLITVLLIDVLISSAAGHVL